MPRLLITNNGVLLDGKWVPATHVHLDMDANSGIVNVQIVMALAERDVVVDVPAEVKLINDENPRTRQIDDGDPPRVSVKPDYFLRGERP